MKNDKKNFFITFSIVFILISLFGCLITYNIYSKNVNDSISNDILLLSYNLEKTFGSNYKELLSNNINSTSLAKKIEEGFNSDQDGNISYPSSYGGMYINSDGKLVVKILNNQQKTVNYIDNLQLSNENEIIKEYVEYSYTELTRIYNVICEYYLENIKNDTNFVGNYIDVENNKVVVELINIENNYIENFKNNVIDSNAVIFKNGERISTKSSYKAGQGFSYNVTYSNNQQTHISSSSCSVGFRTKRNGVSGFVTAGHCFGYQGYNVDSVTFSDGTYVTRQYSTTMDAAFIKLASGNTVVNNLYKTGVQATFINTTGNNYYVNGNVIGLVGSKSGYKTGTISSLSYSATDDDGYYHTNMIKGNITVIEGDSGGPVFTLSSTTLNNGAPLIGIISVGGTGIVGFYKYNDIVSSLRLTKY